MFQLQFKRCVNRGGRGKDAPRRGEKLGYSIVLTRTSRERLNLSKRNVARCSDLSCLRSFSYIRRVNTEEGVLAPHKISTAPIGHEYGGYASYLRTC